MDTAGQERFTSIVNLYFKNIQFIVLVYDLSDNTNMNGIKKWLDIAKVKTNNMPILLVGNKIDFNKLHIHNITQEMISDYNIIGHLKISCLNNTDFKDVQNYLITYGISDSQLNNNIINIKNDNSKNYKYCCF